MRSVIIKPLKKSISVEVYIPSSKSYTNRALLIAAMTNNRVRITNPLKSDDTQAMVKCLKQLGIRVIKNGDNLIVDGGVDTIKNRTYELDANLSGTTIRFLSSLAIVTPGTKILYGKEALNKRPISDLVDSLRQVGAKIEYLDQDGYPPIRVTPLELSSKIIRINGKTSSQYLSGILMISPLLSGTVTVKIVGDQISKPYVNLTLDVMKKFKVSVINRDYKTFVIPKNQEYKATQYFVEGDVSSASYFGAIAALTKSTIILRNLNHNSIQGDMNFLKILERMGSRVSCGENFIKIVGGGVKAVEVDMKNCPDQIQTMAVLAAFANGTTKISGVRSLRVKETNRVTALRQELKKMGVNTVVSGLNRISIHGGKVQEARINTYGDHRMAMAFAVAGTKLHGMEIINPGVVSKTFPEFWESLESIGVMLVNNRLNIVLIGMRNSGKSTVAKILSQKLAQTQIDTDEMITGSLKMSVSEIVRKLGWDYFRDQEARLIKKVSKLTDKIISTGGGVVTNFENVKNLRKNGTVFYLKTSTKTLLTRHKDDDDYRPRLIKGKTPKEEIEILYAKRNKLYQDAADYIIDTENLEAEAVADRIISIVGRR